MGEEIRSMKASARSHWSLTVLFVFGFLFCSSAQLFAATYEEDVSSQDYLFAKGIIHAVSSPEQSLTVHTAKGQRIKILLEQQTEREGFQQIEELQPDGQVKIWYRPGPHGNIGLKIIRLPDLGC